MNVCGITHPAGFGAPEDVEGCRLSFNHDGQPHEYVAQDGRVIQWETDLACDCDGCNEVADTGDGDYCTTYWTKDQAASQPHVSKGAGNA